MYVVIMLISTIFLTQYSKTEIHVFLNQYHNSWLDIFFKYATDLGDGLAIAIIGLILLFFSKRKALQIILSGIISGIIAQVLKKLIFGPTPRPSSYFKDIDISLHYIDGVDLHTVFSFPSGHATAIFTITTSLVLLTKKSNLDLILISIATLVAFSRVYLSQHFLVDIYTGSIIGVSVSVLVYRLLYFSKLTNKNSLDKPLFNFNTN